MADNNNNNNNNESKKKTASIVPTSTAKFANLYHRLTKAYSQIKRLSEDSLDEPMRSGIREREYIKKSSDYNQKLGNLDQVYDDSGLQGVLSIHK